MFIREYICTRMETGRAPALTAHCWGKFLFRTTPDYFLLKAFDISSSVGWVASDVLKVLLTLSESIIKRSAVEK